MYQVNHSKIELVAALKLSQDGPSLFDIEAGLPPDFVVEAVESDRLKDWWRDGDTLHVRFHGAPCMETPLVLHLVKQYKTVPDQLEIKPVVLPEAWEVEGTGIIAAAASVNTSMTLVNAKELNPENAATDFQILPPIERKRGFSFKGRDFSASVKLETVPARVRAEWVMSALAYESRVSVSIHTKLAAWQGSTGGVTFKLPAAAPEARVTGENVRETTSGTDGDWRVYHVIFQHDLTDSTEFTVDLDLPAGGKTALPSFEMQEMDRSGGFVIVDNASEAEMQVEPSGLDVAQKCEIPFLPEISRNARLFRALPGWSLRMGLTRLEKQAGRAAFVAWAEQTSAIRSNGDVWHKVSYHLQNRSLQFLPVRMPEGAEIASVSVAGENVRPDHGQAGGKDALLIPLIKTQPGDMSYDVELVYRVRAARGIGIVSRSALDGPEVVGITVERTLWNLYVPEELSAGAFGGNMEEVLAEVNATEKAEGMLNELKSLNGFLSISRRKSASDNAGQNFRKLKEQLEQNSRLQVNSASVQQHLSKGAAKRQSGYVKQKQEEIQEELGRQRELFANNVSNQRQTVAMGDVAQPAPQSGAVTQNWGLNSGFVSKSTDEEEKAKSVRYYMGTAGKKLYINDNVVNVQSGGADKDLAETATISGATTYAGGTTLSAGNLQVQADATGTVMMNEAKDTLVAQAQAQVQDRAGQAAAGEPAMKQAEAQKEEANALGEDVKY